MTVYLLSIGLISILGQVVLLRELNVAFYGVELIYLLALGIWLFWTAVGAVIGRQDHPPSLQKTAALFFIFGLILIPDLIFIRSSRLIFGDVPGAYLDFFQQVFVAVIAILPVGVVSGLLFQWAAGAYVSAGKTLAAAYAVESTGGLIGGLLSTFLIMGGFQNLSAAFLCALISVITPLVVLRGSAYWFLRRSMIIFIGVLIGLMGSSAHLDRLTTGWNHPYLQASSDSPYGRITVTRMADQISIFENDALSFETGGTDAESFVNLAALQHPHPQKILILGGGLEGIVREALKYTPRHIDYVELNPVMLNLTMHYLPDDIRNSLNAPKVRITYADPRQYLNTSGAYDLILVGMPEPSSGQANRFYTREFFEQCSAKLNPGGIVAFRLRTAENLWTTPLTRRNSSIHAALASVFPDVLFLPGTTNVITASFAPLPRTPDIMAGRLQKMKFNTRLISGNYITYLFTNDRYFQINQLLAETKETPNSDIHPVCYRYALIIWLSKFFPRVTLFDLSSMTSRPLFRYLLFFLLAALPVIFLFSRRRPALRRILLVAAAGFLGMVLETLLLLYYQVKHGVIYQNIGFLLMSFMAGLALGAAMTDKIMTRLPRHRMSPRLYGVGLMVIFCLVCGLTGMMIKTGDAAGLFRIAFLLGATGFTVAGIFAYASLHEIEDQNKVISPLYAADLIGGCAGSVLASLILMPLAGLDVTLWGMLILSVYSVLLL